MRVAATIILCLVTVTALAALQSGRSPLSGSVVDVEGGEMPGVSVSVRGSETRSTTTDAKGRFAFANLPHGDYELRAALEGFNTTVQRVSLTEQTKPITIRLSVGAQSHIVFIGR